MSDIKSVLFVCTGNSCRSVMAEGLLKKYLKDAGKEHIKVSSAGVRTIDGMKPTDETLQVLKENGVAMDDFKSRPVTADMINEADLILVMEEPHKDEILNTAPSAAGKTYLLKEYARHGPIGREEEPGIPDPIGRPPEFYKYCVNLIKKEAERIAKIL